MANVTLTVYAGENIDYVWQTGKNAEISYIKYVFDVNDDLLYTVSGKSATSVNAVLGTLPADITTLNDTNIATYLTAANISISVYIGEDVDHVWSTDENSEITYTAYFYNIDNALTHTVSGSTQSAVMSLVAILPADLNTIDDTNITTYLNEASMSITVFAGDNVDYVWSTNKDAEVSYTKYVYTGDILEYTLSARTRTDVDAVILTLPADIDTIDDGTIAMYLTSANMSLMVYDAAGENVEYGWISDKEGDITYSAYLYDAQEQLWYIVSGDTKAGVNVVLGNIGLLTGGVADLNDTNIATYLTDPNMSITVYAGDVIDYVWSTNKDSEIAYTKYVYSIDDELLYTVSGEDKTAVETIIAALPADLSTINDTNVDL